MANQKFSIFPLSKISVPNLRKLQEHLPSCSTTKPMASFYSLGFSLFILTMNNIHSANVFFFFFWNKSSFCLLLSSPSVSLGPGCHNHLPELLKWSVNLYLWILCCSSTLCFPHSISTAFYSLSQMTSLSHCTLHPGLQHPVLWDSVICLWGPSYTGLICFSMHQAPQHLGPLCLPSIMPGALLQILSSWILRVVQISVQKLFLPP